MARQQYKTVHTSLRTSRKLAVSEHVIARLYFHVLLTSDAYGTLSGDPWDVLHEAVSGVRGYDIDVVTEGLDVLVSSGLLERWAETDGSVWLYVVKHDEIQSKSQQGKRGNRSLPTPPSQRIENPNSEELGGTRRNSEAEETSLNQAKSESVAGTRRVSRGEEKENPSSLALAPTPASHCDCPDESISLDIPNPHSLRFGEAWAQHELRLAPLRKAADRIDALNNIGWDAVPTSLDVSGRDLPTVAHPPSRPQTPLTKPEHDTRDHTHTGSQPIQHADTAAGAVDSGVAS